MHANFAFRICLLFVLAAGVGSATAQDCGSPIANFYEVYNLWNDVEKQFDELTTKFATVTDAAERDKLKAEYTALVKKSEELLPKLRTTALEALGSLPDPKVHKTLLGMVAYEYRRDDYDAALEIAQKLLDKNVDDPVLHALAGQAAFCTDDYAAADEHLHLAAKAGPLNPDAQRFLDELPERKELWRQEQEKRSAEAKAAEDRQLPRVKLTTNKGEIVLELFEDEAPNTVANFITLVEKGFYDGVVFHRVLPGFMAQGGDPTGTGTGGPGYQIECEYDDRDDYRRHFRGSLSMAHSGPDTGGSQFFLTFRPTPHLDNLHTCFGRVVEGFEVLPQLQRRSPPGANLPPADKIEKAEVLRKRDHAYEVKKMPK